MLMGRREKEKERKIITIIIVIVNWQHKKCNISAHQSHISRVKTIDGRAWLCCVVGSGAK